VQSDEIGPSTLLTGRYRLEELLSEASTPGVPADVGPVRTWRAVDEVLSRPVVAHVVNREHPQADAMVTAARAAAAINDPRLISVFDAHVNGVAYVIREWFDADSLAAAILGNGPLTPDAAGQMAREVAEALAVAHAAGMAHRRIDPQCVLVAGDGAVKVLGLGIDLVLRGLPEDAARSELWADPGARDDARGVGLVLHAALTGRWAGAGPSTLSTAPRTASGRILSPRQCVPGVPRALDLITERSVDDHPRHGETLRSPAEVAAALANAGVGPAEAVPDFSLPPVAGVLAARRPNFGVGAEPPTSTNRVAAEYDTEYSLAAQAEPAAEVSASAALLPAGAGSGRAGGHRGGSGSITSGPVPRGAANGGSTPTRRGPRPVAPASFRRRRQVVFLVAVLVALGIVLLGWQLVTTALNSRTSTVRTAGAVASAGAGPGASAGSASTPAPSPSTSAAPSATREVLKITDAGDFDPLGDGGEHPDLIRDAYDKDASTAWTTMQYRSSPYLGGLKSGVGMWIDLGTAMPVASISLDLVGVGTDLEIRVPTDARASSPPPAITDWRTVTKEAGLGSTADLTFDQPVEARFVLVWFTKLPPDGTGNYRGGIQEIVARG
jgi:hypothetical protein